MITVSVARFFVDDRNRLFDPNTFFVYDRGEAGEAAVAPLLVGSFREKRFAELFVQALEQAATRGTVAEDEELPPEEELPYGEEARALYERRLSDYRKTLAVERDVDGPTEAQR